jgi:hypothetical protein
VAPVSAFENTGIVERLAKARPRTEQLPLALDPLVENEDRSTSLV